MTSFPGVLVTCFAIGMLGGCSLVPAYHRPEVATPAAWQTTPAADLTHAVPVASAWWRCYGDPALDALMERTLDHNQSLASAMATVAAARASAEKAGAALYPTVTLNGSAVRGHAPTSDSASTMQSLFAQASYEVDFWGLNAANGRAAQALANASEFDRDVVGLTLTASVADTYFQVQSLRKRLALANAVALDAQRLLQLVTAQREAGVATELQVQQQRNALAVFQSEVPILEQQRDQALHLLAMLAGTVPALLEIPEVGLDAIDIPEVQPELPSRLLETRPDIRAQEARLKAANEAIGAARAAFFPDFSLTAEGGTGSRSLADFLRNPLGDVTAALVGPLFDGGALRAQLKFSRAMFDKTVADYRQTVISAFQDAEDALTGAYELRRAEAADIQAAEAANRAAVLAQAEYEAGTVDFLTVLDAERTHYQADDTREQARLARLQASVGVFRAFGGGMTADPAQLGQPGQAGERAGNTAG